MIPTGPRTVLGVFLDAWALWGVSWVLGFLGFLEGGAAALTGKRGNSGQRTGSAKIAALTRTQYITRRKSGEDRREAAEWRRQKGGSKAATMRQQCVNEPDNLVRGVFSRYVVNGMESPKLRR